MPLYLFTCYLLFIYLSFYSLIATVFACYLPKPLDTNGCLLDSEKTPNYLFRPNLLFQKIVNLLSILTGSRLVQ